VPDGEKDQGKDGKGDGTAVGVPVEPEIPQHQGQCDHDGRFADDFCFA
jgi:hypothetical protein